MKTHSVAPARLRTAVVLAAALALFVVIRLLTAPGAVPHQTAGDYAEYERAVVTRIVTDNTERDPASDGGWRGEQTLLADVTNLRTLVRVSRMGSIKGKPCLSIITSAPCTAGRFPRVTAAPCLYLLTATAPTPPLFMNTTGARL